MYHSHLHPCLRRHQTTPAHLRSGHQTARIPPLHHPQPITTSSPFTNATLPCHSSPTAAQHISLFMKPTPKSYTPSHRSLLTLADRNSKSPMDNSSSPLYLDSSGSPTPTSHCALTCSAIMTSPIICSTSLHYCGTVIQLPSPKTISPCTHQATCSCTAPKPHDPTLGDSPCPDRLIFARRPSSDTNSMPRWSPSPTPRSDPQHIRCSTARQHEDGYTTTPI